MHNLLHQLDLIATSPIHITEVARGFSTEDDSIINDNTFPLLSMTELNYSHQFLHPVARQRRRRRRKKNKLKYDSERENKQTTGWRSALKGNAPFNESLKLEVETQYRIWKPPPAAENELRTPTNEKLLAKKLLPPSSTFVESGRLLCFAESVVYTQWNEYLQLAVET